MLDTSGAAHALELARAFADGAGLRAQLEARLAKLASYGAPHETRCILSPDAAPHSFTFVMEVRRPSGGWMRLREGALVYHGPYGTAHAPAFTPKRTPTTGWSIHA
jgi:hypothetical protein